MNQVNVFFFRVVLVVMNLVQTMSKMRYMYVLTIIIKIIISDKYVYMYVVYLNYSLQEGKIVITKG